MISFLVAMDRNRLIGRNNQLPWHLPDDLRYFKRTTMGHPVIMGRKTFESIGRALPGRENIVLTTGSLPDAAGVTVRHSVSDLLESGVCAKQECFVIGGARLFTLLLPYADRLYMTRIDESFAGDTYFDAFNEADWKLVSQKKGCLDQKNRYPHTFEIYERRTYSDRCFHAPVSHA